MRNVLEIKDDEHERDRRYFDDYIRDSILYYGNNSHDPDCYRRLKLRMKISEIITDKYKLRIPPTVYYDLLADVREVEEEQKPFKPMVEIDLDYVIKQKYIEREVLDKIREQMKDYLRGVEITLEVLVENDPLRPKMEGAKDTLEECLNLIDKAESEDKG